MSNLLKPNSPIISSKSHRVPICFHSPYINDGYRVNYSFCDSVLSLFSLHNETMNIWSHLLGFFCMLIIGLDYFIEEEIITENSFSADYNGYMFLQIYIFSSLVCLIFSTFYHWFGCISESYHSNLLRLDLTGIALLVGGSFLPATYFAFFCVPAWQRVHLTLSSLVLAIGLTLPWIDAEYNGTSIRTYVFASLVVLGLVPLLHWLCITPIIYSERLYLNVLFFFLSYGTGFFFFVTRFPEKKFPNSFISTYIIPSHTLWHLMVLVAVILWYGFLTKYQDLLMEHGCEPYYSQNQGQPLSSASIYTPESIGMAALRGPSTSLLDTLH